MKLLLRTAAVLALLTLVTAAQADDPPGKALDEFAQRAKIAHQALKTNVDSALARAGKLPADLALIALETAENEVKDAYYLTQAEKKTLLDQIEQKKKLVTLTSGRKDDPANRVARPPKNDSHDDFIRSELSAIKTLTEQGNLAAAQARRKSLADRYPTHPALTADVTINNRRDAIFDGERIRNQRNQSRVAAEQAIDKSTTNLTDSVYFPPDFKEKTKDRQPAGAISFSNRERELLNKLDEQTQTDIHFNNTTFDQVLKTLEKEMGITLVIGKSTMDEVRVAYDSPLTFQMPKGVSKRNLLKSVLAELGLTYVIKAETLHVVSVLQAKNEMRVGFMDVGTVLSRGGSPDDLIKMIKSQIEPDSWDTGGGNGTITYVLPGYLIIKNSSEVIYRLGAKPKR